MVSRVGKSCKFEMKTQLNLLPDVKPDVKTMAAHQNHWKNYSKSSLNAPDSSSSTKMNKGRIPSFIFNEKKD